MKRNKRRPKSTLELFNKNVGLCLIRYTRLHDFAMVITPSGVITKFRNDKTSTALYKAEKHAAQIAG